MSRTIFVTGATGNQGGGVVKALIQLDSTITIHALVRDPNSAASQSLLALSSNIKLFQSDFDNLPSIAAAASGCTAAFLYAKPVHTEIEAGETRHVKNLVAACISTPSLTRIVFSSSGAMHKPLSSPLWTDYIPQNPTSWMTHYMRSKRAGEFLIETTTLPDGWCILRPMVFLTNFLIPASRLLYPELATNQTITTAFKPDLQLSYVDPTDISVLAATALLSDVTTWNANFKGQRVPLGGPNLTLAQVVSTMNNVLADAGSSKQITLKYVPEDEAKQKTANGDLVLGSQLFQNDHGVYLESHEVSKFGVDVQKLVTAEEFFAREEKAVIAAVGGL